MQTYLSKISATWFTGTLYSIGALLVLALTEPASGTPVQWTVASGGNGHYYERVSSPGILWVNAKAGAELMAYAGMTGYLATVTSSGENEFIRSNLTHYLFYGGWIGASDAGIEGAWNWVTGPEAGTQFWSGDHTGSATAYANWYTGEPDGGAEGYADYAYIYLKSSDPKRGKWWDASIGGDSGVSGYLVEYGAAVPAPAPLLLLGTGLAGLLFAGRRRRANGDGRELPARTRARICW